MTGFHYPSTQAVNSASGNRAFLSRAHATVAAGQWHYIASGTRQCSAIDNIGTSLHALEPASMGLCRSSLQPHKIMANKYCCSCDQRQMKGADSPSKVCSPPFNLITNSLCPGGLSRDRLYNRNPPAENCLLDKFASDRQHNCFKRLLLYCSRRYCYTSRLRH